jgi:hypothetical protein
MSFESTLSLQPCQVILQVKSANFSHQYKILNLQTEIIVLTVLASNLLFQILYALVLAASACKKRHSIF